MYVQAIRCPMQKATSMTNSAVSAPIWEPTKSLAIKSLSQSIEESSRVQMRPRPGLQVAKLRLGARQPVGAGDVFGKTGAIQIKRPAQLPHPQREAVVEFQFQDHAGHPRVMPHFRRRDVASFPPSSGKSAVKGQPHVVVGGSHPGLAFVIYDGSPIGVDAASQ